MPPHCPRSDCRYHACAPGWRWVRHGSYRRQCEPQVIGRFRCRHCGHTFSSQSFSPTYWLKRPELLAPVFHRLLACSGYRQIAREARCDPTTVMGLAARLGRHSLLYLHTHRPRGPLREPLVIDGFESFAYSQYHPLHLNLGVGTRSHYTYGFTASELRRKGRMSARQKRRRAWLEARFGRPDPRAIEHGMATLLRLAYPGGDRARRSPAGVPELHQALLGTSRRRHARDAPRAAHAPGPGGRDLGSEALPRPRGAAGGVGALLPTRGAHPAHSSRPPPHPAARVLRLDSRPTEGACVHSATFSPAQPKRNGPARTPGRRSLRADPYILLCLCAASSSAGVIFETL